VRTKSWLQSFLIGSATLAEPAGTEPCSAGPYMVFFDQNSSALKEQARAILDWAAKAYSNCSNAGVLMAGHPDRLRTDEANLALSKAMANNVRHYLTAHEVPASQFTVGWLGERQPLVRTEDEVSEPQNRRVEFIFSSDLGSQSQQP
jgi:outer membrane protein OmpA-like peptidoglycan-associated protein